MKQKFTWKRGKGEHKFFLHSPYKVDRVEAVTVYRCDELPGIFIARTPDREKETHWGVYHEELGAVIWRGPIRLRDIQALAVKHLAGVDWSVPDASRKEQYEHINGNKDLHERFNAFLADAKGLIA